MVGRPDAAPGLSLDLQEGAIFYSKRKGSTTSSQIVMESLKSKTDRWWDTF